MKKTLKNFCLAALCVASIAVLCDLAVIAWDYTMPDEQLSTALENEPTNEHLQNIARSRGWTCIIEANND